MFAVLGWSPLFDELERSVEGELVFVIVSGPLSCIWSMCGEVFSVWVGDSGPEEWEDIRLCW